MPDDLSIGKILSKKKYRGARLISKKKTEVLYAELIFYNIFWSLPTCLVLEFSFTDIF